MKENHHTMTSYNITLGQKRAHQGGSANPSVLEKACNALNRSYHAKSVQMQKCLRGAGEGKYINTTLTAQKSNVTAVVFESY